MRIRTAAVFAAYAAAVPAANWLIGNVGECIPDGPCVVPVGFGLFAPSGTLLVGGALVLRDFLQDWTSKRTVLLAVLLGSALSVATSAPELAVASAAAFAVSEVADMAVYTPLRPRSRLAAVLCSGTVGALLDSMLFMAIAFGTLDFSLGTTLAKVYASGAATAALAAVAVRRRARAK